MVMPSLVPKSISRLEPFISETLRTLWDEGLRDGRIDWVRTVAQRTPMRVIAELIGFPAYDVDDLVRWSFAATVLLDGVVTSEQLGSATQAIGELSDYLDRAFATACEAPADHVMGDLARMVNSGTIERGTAVLILLQLVAAGAESTVSLIGSAAWLLGTEPDLQNRLRADSGLVPTFIEEAVRLESPFRGHYRHVVADTTLGDVALPAGSHLYLSWAAANRDPSRHDAPDTVTLDATGRRPHLAFGKGIHLCVGAALARLEGRLAIDWLLNVTDHFTVDGGDAEWERSLLVRRLRSLPLTVTA